ncbi:MAG: RNA 2',3'-cyclic phosphodiesterase [Gammaproteobacteria bacterium]|nr:RNA 2',3'-cyclic phosphodiesterase [Gammaproteobacteria bacterium]
MAVLASGTDRLRGFLACRLPDAAARALGERLEPVRLRFHQGSVRWVPTPNLHLTLRFLGAIEHTRANALRQALAPVVATLPPLGVELAGLCELPSAGVARVIALAVTPTDLLQRLAAAIDDVLDDVREHPFTAHVTVVRLKRPGRVLRAELLGAVAELAAQEPLSVRLDQMGLYRSDMTAQGPMYTPVWQLPFGIAQADKPS